MKEEETLDDIVNRLKERERLMLEGAPEERRDPGPKIREPLDPKYVHRVEEDLTDLLEHSTMSRAIRRSLTDARRLVREALRLG